MASKAWLEVIRRYAGRPEPSRRRPVSLPASLAHILLTGPHLGDPAHILGGDFSLLTLERSQAAKLLQTWLRPAALAAYRAASAVRRASSTAPEPDGSSMANPALAVTTS